MGIIALVFCRDEGLHEYGVEVLKTHTLPIFDKVLSYGLALPTVDDRCLIDLGIFEVFKGRKIVKLQEGKYEYYDQQTYAIGPPYPSYELSLPCGWLCLRHLHNFIRLSKISCSNAIR